MDYVELTPLHLLSHLTMERPSAMKGSSSRRSPSPSSRSVKFHTFKHSTTGGVAVTHSEDRSWWASFTGLFTTLWSYPVSTGPTTVRYRPANPLYTSDLRQEPEVGWAAWAMSFWTKQEELAARREVALERHAEQCAAQLALQQQLAAEQFAAEQLVATSM